jgi:hypothetical protein
MNGSVDSSPCPLDGRHIYDVRIVGKAAQTPVFGEAFLHVLLP